MTTYHRGKARSPYRKRFAGVNLSHTTAGIKVQTLVPSPPAGTVETKSWRGIASLHGVDTDNAVATGWCGFWRGQLSVNDLEAVPASGVLAMSECFGVVPYTLGRNDFIMPMGLVGVTLAVAEALYFVSGLHFDGAGSATIRVSAALLYAEKEVPA